jgi:hypothetical protein
MLRVAYCMEEGKTLRFLSIDCSPSLITDSATCASDAVHATRNTNSVS